jgi:uncharacterized protein YjbI with pentapeptide repeats
MKILTKALTAAGASLALALIAAPAHAVSDYQAGAQLTGAQLTGAQLTGAQLT